MNVETVLESIKKYKKIPTLVIASCLKERVDEANASAQEIKFIAEILSLKVSGVSRFTDPVWAFPEAQERAAKTHFVSRFEIDFRAYSAIPELVVFQSKLVLLMAMLVPRSELSKGQRKNSALKVQSVLPLFKAFLTYLNHVFSNMNSVFGKDVVIENFQSLEALKRNHYLQYSEGFETTSKMALQIERTASFFQSQRVHKLLFSEHVSFPRLAQTSAVVVESKTDDREKVLPDHGFEEASAVSGYLVADFLTKLKVDLADQKSLDLMRSFPFDMGTVQLLDIDWVVFDNYAMSRLAGKKYPFEDALHFVGSAANLLTDRHTKSGYKNALLEYIGSTGSIDEIRRYLDAVYRAAVYLIAQYSGMRPSELVDILLNTPLETSFGVPCLVSQVRKHQSSERALFDDKWVCIPAMVDALEAAKIISRTRANPYLISKAETVPYGVDPSPMSRSGIKYILKEYFQQIRPSGYKDFSLYPYVLRHTLAYQLFRADLGLPFISHQLKHFGNLVGAFSSASNKGFSVETLGYGEIGEKLSGSSSRGRGLRHQAEIDAVRSSFDPGATYAGVNGEAHSQRMIRIFEGYQASGYSKEEIFEAMAEQGMAIVNVGIGMCYGGKVEDFDDSLPCIGGLRCNPVRCSNAVVTPSHIPKWRDVYIDNMKLAETEEESDIVREQARAIANEARMVLKSLGAL